MDAAPSALGASDGPGPKSPEASQPARPRPAAAHRLPAGAIGRGPPEERARLNPGCGFRFKTCPSEARITSSSRTVTGTVWSIWLTITEISSCIRFYQSSRDNLRATCGGQQNFCYAPKLSKPIVKFWEGYTAFP
jgi:hypothetical protein